MTVSVESLVCFNIISQRCSRERVLVNLKNMEAEVNEVLSKEVLDEEKHDSADEELLYLDELEENDLPDEVDELDLSSVFADMSRDSVMMNVATNLVDSVADISEREVEVSEELSLVEKVIPQEVSISEARVVQVSLPGLRLLPDPALESAGRGLERQPSENNDRWASKRADALRQGMGWDMSVPLGDVPLQKLDELFAAYFARAVKKDGSLYPSSSLMNMMNAFNRVIRRASDIRSLRGETVTVVARDFNINSHPAFARTRMVLRAAIKKSAKEGANKKRKKVELLTEEHERAILADIDHQVSSSHGCQKRLAFYCLVRLGIRGGGELWDLHRKDLSICVDKAGKNYVQFEERQSKNNSYTLDRYNEEQFRKQYHSYEDDFVLTVMQYMRHLPPANETLKPDLFMQAISNPVGVVWYNKVHKVGRETAANWLKSMLKIVGLPPDIFSNRSGRSTLVSRLASKGVPNEIGMMITGHHSTGGYLRYDKTQGLKMQAAALVSANPGLDYETALAHVSKDFLKEELIGTSEGLNPLIKRVSDKAEVQPSLIGLPQGAGSLKGKEVAVVTTGNTPASNRWDDSYDNIDWVGEILKKNPVLHERISAPGNSRVTVGSNISGNSFHNCTVTIKMVKPREEDDKENQQ